MLFAIALVLYDESQSISHSSERGQMTEKSVSIHAQINPFCHGFYAV